MKWKKLKAYQPQAENEDIVLCCQLADAPHMIAGAKFDRRCSRCGAIVMIAPSGQLFLKNYPTTRIICVSCYMNQERPAVRHALAADPKTIEQELRNTIPNLWRKRN
jgi:hypothetical protein